MRASFHSASDGGKPLKSRKRSAKLELKFFMLSCILTFLLAPAAARAQQPQHRLIFNDALPPPAAPQATAKVAEEDEDEDDFIIPNRPGTAGPAEFHKPGVLQAGKAHSPFGAG